MTTKKKQIITKQDICARKIKNGFEAKQTESKYDVENKDNLDRQLQVIKNKIPQKKTFNFYPHGIVVIKKIKDQVLMVSSRRQSTRNNFKMLQQRGWTGLVLAWSGNALYENIHKNFKG